MNDFHLNQRDLYECRTMTLKVACTSGPIFEKNYEAVPYIFSSNN